MYSNFPNLYRIHEHDHFAQLWTANHGSGILRHVSPPRISSWHEVYFLQMTFFTLPFTIPELLIVNASAFYHYPCRIPVSKDLTHSFKLIRTLYYTQKSAVPPTATYYEVLLIFFVFCCGIQYASRTGHNLHMDLCSFCVFSFRLC